MTMTKESLEVIKEVATLSAKTAAHEVVREVREDIRVEIASMGAELRKDLRDDFSNDLKNAFENHFGSMSGSDHVIAHSRLNSMLEGFENFSNGFWGAFAKKLGTFIFGVLIVGVAYLIAAKGGIGSSIVSGK